MEQSNTGFIRADTSIHLHPLVLLSVADHAARLSVQQELNRNQENASNTPEESPDIPMSGSDAESSTMTIGFLFGELFSEGSHIHQCVEAKYSQDGDKMTIDKQFLQDQSGLITEVYPSYELLGWYIVSSMVPGQQVMDIHEQMKQFTETPLLLVLHPTPPEDTTELPVAIYTAEFSTSKNCMEFHQIQYKIDTTESERITIDHATHAHQVAPTEDPRVDPLIRHQQAVSMFQDRINTILSYLYNLRDKKTTSNPILLRKLSELANNIPILKSHVSKQEENIAENDNQLLHLMTTMTNVAETLKQTASDVSFCHQKDHRFYRDQF